MGKKDEKVLLQLWIKNSEMQRLERAAKSYGLTREELAKEYIKVGLPSDEELDEWQG